MPCQNRRAGKYEFSRRSAIHGNRISINLTESRAFWKVVNFLEVLGKCRENVQLVIQKGHKLAIATYLLKGKSHAWNQFRKPSRTVAKIRTERLNPKLKLREK
jgi:hypothetical protein